MIEAGHKILQAGLPDAIKHGNNIYQESFSGTPTSDLFYPIVRAVYCLGNKVFSSNEGEKKSTSWALVIVKVTIVSGALFYGKLKEKSLSLLLGEFLLFESQSYLNNRILKETTVTTDTFQYYLITFQYYLIFGIFGAISAYFQSKRNPTLPLKGYCFFAVAHPVSVFLKGYFLNGSIRQYITDQMSGESDAEKKVSRYLQMYYTLSTIALSIFTAKGATLITGESLKIDWKVNILSKIAADAVPMFL